VVVPRHPRQGAEQAEDALAICLDNHARVDMAVIADLLGTEVATARAELGELVWDNLATGAVESAQRYLAGDVRAKLAEAERAAAADPRWLPNVEALRAVVPIAVAQRIDTRGDAFAMTIGDTPHHK